VALPAAGAGHSGDSLAVDVELECVVVGGDGDDLAGVDHADLDALRCHHYLAALGYSPLHCHRATGRGRNDAGGSACTSEPMPVTNEDRAGQNAQQRAIMTDDSHLSALHTQRNPLSGQLEADIELGARQADQPDGIDHPMTYRIGFIPRCA
jgi:hypothetical protein